MKQLMTCVALACACAASFAQTARCGGIGEDQQKQMKAEAAQHGLLLSFAESTGSYLSDVDVAISSGKGEVLRTRCGGPLMLVDLPPGATYRVTAQPPKGAAQVKSVTFAGKPTTLAFTWPAS